MSDPRGKQWTLTLFDGRKVTIGAGVDEDPGVWILNPEAQLLRWLTAEDAKAIAATLREAAGWLELNPPRRRKAGRR